MRTSKGVHGTEFGLSYLKNVKNHEILNLNTVLETNKKTK